MTADLISKYTELSGAYQAGYIKGYEEANQEVLVKKEYPKVYPYNMGIFYDLIREYNEMPGIRCGSTPDMTFWIEFNRQFIIDEVVSGWTLSEFLRVMEKGKELYEKWKVTHDSNRNR